jgi:protocatechuate 3,4-dioxygenase beta subunit
MYIGIPKEINSSDTSIGWDQKGQKLLITGLILKSDGHTPAPNVILYYYHTDIIGIYPNSKDLNQKVARHGKIRGWVKSDNDGRYSIYTVRPAAYPNRSDPAHIHPSIKEPNQINEYYIDDFVFDDDPLLTTAKRRAMENRGGSGVLRTFEKGELKVAEHNIILGSNIPNYPFTEQSGIESGPKIGEDIFSFTPKHIWGADIGSSACPICKYGRQMGILYFAGDNDKTENIQQWLLYLENQATLSNGSLKTFLIFSGNKIENNTNIDRFEQMAKRLKIRHVALAYVPNFSDQQSEIYLNKINPMAENTILVYKNSNVIGNFIDLQPTQNNLKSISELVSSRSSLNIKNGN